MSEVVATDGALAMVDFLLLRLEEEADRLPRVNDRVRLARHIGGLRGLADEWLGLVTGPVSPSPEMQAWRRGMADGILVALLAAAYPYADHPDWDEEWA